MAYRLLSASKDTYVTDKVISQQRTPEANVGQAGTLDLFKLFNESTLSGTTFPIEVSRLLVQFDYSELDTTIVALPSFTASISLKNVYGGQTVPSNYTLVAYPMSKSWDEGRGFDVASYRDIDSANFVTASTGVSWSASGASGLGNLGADVDAIVSGDIGSGLEALGVFQTFTRGDEDGLFNVTSLVSASVVGILPNNGFRISFIQSEEDDGITRFVKRFGSRHTFNTSLRPKLKAEWTDRIVDDAGSPLFGVSQSFYTYNHLNGNLTNFVSGGADVSSLVLELAASRSVVFTTSSFQANFSASISHATSSVLTYTQTFTASLPSTGIYTAAVMLDPTSDRSLNDFLTGSNTPNAFSFKGTWKSTDGNTTYASTYFAFSKLLGGGSNAPTPNYVVNAVGLKDEYTQSQEARIRVFVQDRDASQVAHRWPKPAQGVILQDMRWRLVKAFTDEEVIPFGVHTKMSTDSDGMYFDMSIEDLDLGEVYELEFLITNETGKDVVIHNKGFIFKVVT